MIQGTKTFWEIIRRANQKPDKLENAKKKGGKDKDDNKS